MDNKWANHICDVGEGVSIPGAVIKAVYLRVSTRLWITGEISYAPSQPNAEVNLIEIPRWPQKLPGYLPECSSVPFWPWCFSLPYMRGTWDDSIYPRFLCFLQASTWAHPGSNLLEPHTWASLLLASEAPYLAVKSHIIQPSLTVDYKKAKLDNI